MLPICILTIQDEDDRAYMSRLFVQYHRLMYQCTYEVLDDKWATEDAVQTTLLRLIDRIDVVRQLDESKLPGYIAAACRHTAYNVLAITAATPRCRWRMRRRRRPRRTWMSCCPAGWS